MDIEITMAHHGRTDRPADDALSLCVGDGEKLWCRAGRSRRQVTGGAPLKTCPR